MMSVPYRTNPIFNADWSIISHELRTDTPGLLNDVSTQTTGANLITSCVPDFSLSKVSEQRRLAETPQVMASQCRGLLQQLSKLQLGHHSKDSLHRLRSELKELISIFSAAPKTKILFPMSTHIPLKGGRKLNSSSSTNNSSQSVFEQYNVKLITPKQVTINKQQPLDMGTASESEQAEDDVDTDVEEEGGVDGMYISTVSEEQVVEDNVEIQHQQQHSDNHQVMITLPTMSQSASIASSLMVSSKVAAGLKRTHRHHHHHNQHQNDEEQDTSRFLKTGNHEEEPAQKKHRINQEEDESGICEDEEMLENITVTHHMPQQEEVIAGDGTEAIDTSTTDPSSGNCDESGVMQFPGNTTLSTVIDGQTISISLDQVAAMAAAANDSGDVGEGDPQHQEILTFTTSSTMVDGETLITTGEDSNDAIDTGETEENNIEKENELDDASVK